MQQSFYILPKPMKQYIVFEKRKRENLQIGIKGMSMEGGYCAIIIGAIL